MKKNVLLLLTFWSVFAFSQIDIDATFNEGAVLYNDGKYQEANQKFEQILAVKTDHALSWMGAGYCNLMLKNWSLSKVQLQNAQWIDYLDPQAAQGLAILELVNGGSMVDAQKWLNNGICVWLNPQQKTDFETEVKNDADKLGNQKLLELLDYASKKEIEMQSSSASWQKINNQYFEAVEKLNANNFAAADAIFKKILTLLKANLNQYNGHTGQMAFYMGDYFQSLGQSSYALYYFEWGFNFLMDQNIDSPYWITILAARTAAYYNNYGQFTKTLALTAKSFNRISKNPVTHSFGDLMAKRLSAQKAKYVNVTNPVEKQDYLQDAKTLLSLAGTMKTYSEYYSCLAKNHLMLYYILSAYQSDRNKAFAYGEEAFLIAQKNGFEDLQNSISSNLAISYFQNGQHEKARQVTLKSAQADMANNNFTNANIAYTNLGAMYLYDNNVAASIPYFKKAIEITEKERFNIPVESRMQYQSVEYSSYRFLIDALAKTKQSEELYKALEQFRGRSLSDKLSEKQLIDPGLKWVQNKLKADEALLMFGVVGSGEVALVIVTKNAVKSVYHRDVNFDKNLQNHFAKAYQIALNIGEKEQRGYYNPFKADGLDKVGQVTGVLRELLQDHASTSGMAATVKTDILKAFYNFLMADAEPYLAGINNLVICPDTYLGFIPFEALVTRDNQYLIQKYGIRYVPSVTVWKAMEDRNYSNERKNILAFGGATYAPYTINAPLARDENSFMQLLLKVDQDLKAKKSLRYNYAALGVSGKSWTYLQGTLAEVLEIEKKVAGVEVFTGAEFSEKKIKTMSNSGDLANYKVLHLATHGMVVPTLPEMSTIITTLNMTESDGEDGYLNQVEISELKLKADFVALSACETGLGKVFAGEGVSGLMQSLVLAGANGMSVSLWAVSDQGTMYFMIGLYDLVFNQGYAYADAMNLMKRKFIRGDYGETFKHPNFWAPYVYYGK